MDCISFVDPLSKTIVATQDPPPSGISPVIHVNAKTFVAAEKMHNVADEYFKQTGQVFDHDEIVDIYSHKVYAVVPTDADNLFYGEFNWYTDKSATPQGDGIHNRVIECSFTSLHEDVSDVDPIMIRQAIMQFVTKQH